MQNIIAMEALSVVSEKGFSLDELVFKTKELFEEQGLAGFVALILRLLDERICIDLVQGKHRKKLSTCCSEPHYHHLDQLDRQFRTSIGKVIFRWRRLRCQNCGRTIIPLRTFLGLQPYQSKTSELKKIVTEVVSEQSYRPCRGLTALSGRAIRRSKDLYVIESRACTSLIVRVRSASISNRI